MGRRQGDCIPGRGTSILEGGGPAGLSEPWKVQSKEDEGNVPTHRSSGEKGRQGEGAALCSRPRRCKQETRKEGHVCGDRGARQGQGVRVKVTATTFLHTTPGLPPMREVSQGWVCTRAQKRVNLQTQTRGRGVGRTSRTQGLSSRNSGNRGGCPPGGNGAGPGSWDTVCPGPSSPT